MRKMILDRIEALRATPDGFNSESMRWRNCYVFPKTGLVRVLSKRDRSNGVPITKTDRTHFEALSDVNLLFAFETISRIMSKQY